MEGVNVMLWLLVCWVVCALSWGGEQRSRDVEENTTLMMKCHPADIYTFTQRVWYSGYYTENNPPTTNKVIYDKCMDTGLYQGPKHRTGMACDDTCFTLTIDRILLKDRNFTCVTINQGTKYYSHHPINVYREGSLEMTGLDAVIYSVGDVVTVSCNYSKFYPEIVNTKLNIQWGSDAPVTSTNTTAVGDTYFSYTATKPSHSLVKEDDKTKVNCSVTPTVGTAPSPVVEILNVHYAPFGSVVLSVHDVEAHPNYTVVFTCDTKNNSANPTVNSVKWMKDGSPLPDWSSTEFTHTILATGNDNGTYTCTVTNGIGNLTSKDMEFRVSPFYPMGDASSSHNTCAIVGGVMGGLAVIGIITTIVVVAFFMKRRATPIPRPTAPTRSELAGSSPTHGTAQRNLMQRDVAAPYSTVVFKSQPGEDGGYVVPVQVQVNEAPPMYEQLAAPPVYTAIHAPLYSNTAYVNEP